MKRIVALLTLALVAGIASNAQTRSKAWCPDNGDGTYTNPVLFADYSDPDVCAVGEDYYLTASSFSNAPALPILHSRDLVNWEIIGHAIKDLSPKADFALPSHGNGVWAPCIRYHEGEFYIYWGDPDRGIYMVRTDGGNPAGKWQDPVLVVEGKGMIDPTPLWDDDGRCYLFNGWAGSRAGFNSILTGRELTKDGCKAITDPVIVFDGWDGNKTCEGPKAYKKDGYYWVFFPAGGVKTGWQVAMRSKNVYGPYEARTVMSQGSSSINGPHQGGWVHTPQGEDWFLHFNDRYEYGRVVYLQPMQWKDGWPVIGIDRDGDGCGEPVVTYKKPLSSSTAIFNPSDSDEFEGKMGLQWQWQANYDQLFGMPTPDGCMRLYTCQEPEGNLWMAPNMMLQKTPAETFSATAKVRIAGRESGQYAGMIMMGMDYSAIVAEWNGENFIVKRLTCQRADKGGEQKEDEIETLKPTFKDKDDYSPATFLDIYFRMKVSGGKCSFSYSLDGKRFKDAGDTFKMKEGKWIGAKIGLISEAREPKEPRKGNTLRGWMDADWFRVEK